MTGNIQAEPGASPSPQTRCLVCNHPDRTEIEAALLSAPLRAVETRFEVGRASLHNHRNEHMPEAVRHAAQTASVRLALNGAAVARRIEQLHAAAEEVFCETKGIDNRSALRALTLMQRQAEFAWRAAASAPVSPAMSPTRFEAMAQAILRLLEPHLEIRSEMAEALREIELRFSGDEQELAEAAA